MSENNAVVAAPTNTGRREALAVSTDAADSRGSITQLLNLAIEKGASAADLKELVGLHERIADREAEQEFARAMAAFKAECPPLIKARTAKIITKGGGSYSFDYADLDDIAKVIDPVLHRHGLSYSWDSLIEGGALTCICIIRHVNGHSQPSRFTLPIENPSAMNPQQKVGAAMSFAQRRSLCSALGLTTTDEDAESVRQVDPTPITEDQVTAIQDLITETKTDAVRFLKHFDIANLAELPVVRYAEAISVLDTKKRRAGA